MERRDVLAVDWIPCTRSFFHSHTTLSLVALTSSFRTLTRTFLVENWGRSVKTHPLYFRNPTPATLMDSCSKPVCLQSLLGTLPTKVRGLVMFVT